MYLLQNIYVMIIVTYYVMVDNELCEYEMFSCT